MTDTKLNKAELLKKIHEIIDGATSDPADEMIICGETLIEIGKALKGLSVTEQRNVIHAAIALEGYAR